MTRLAKDLAALPDMNAAQLRNRWEKMEEGAPPRVPPSILRPLLAQRLQERRHGALPALVMRELMQVAQRGSDHVSLPPRTELMPGTRLIREWNGKTISVDVLEEGFAYDNQTWRSLSEIARHITGAHWSGPRFFGLNCHG
jgi:hypothetical protein